MAKRCIISSAMALNGANCLAASGVSMGRLTLCGRAKAAHSSAGAHCNAHEHDTLPLRQHWPLKGPSRLRREAADGDETPRLWDLHIKSISYP